MKFSLGLAPLIPQYDLFLLDLWGVVHDGTQLYPGVRDTLVAINEAKKTVMFLSNAPRRAHKVEAVLAQLGIERDLYREVVASGEVGYQWLKDKKIAFGKNYYFIGAARDADVLSGLDYVRVDDLKDADFLLNCGFGTEEQTSDDYSPLLRAAKAQGVPMLCLNPDLEVVKISGGRFPCAGVLGKEYERLGGKVQWFGKPYQDVYEYALREVHTAKNKILAVGDSLETDIPGGQAFGIDTVLITGGILKDKTTEEITLECLRLGLRPTYTTPAFRI